MFKAAILIFIISFLTTVDVGAQTTATASLPDRESILAGARLQLNKGASCYQAGDMDCARQAFDRAVDYFLESGHDVRSDDRLLQGWREVIETIKRYQTDAFKESNAKGWKTQEFDGRPEELADSDETEEDETITGPLTAEDFQRKFTELERMFQEKFKREFVVTGADHEEHRRLYGRGSAIDVRVRDLSRDQISFLIETGKRLGLRVKDFSTWEKVEAHNARSQSLNRPADTYATGLHLHIDRMARPNRKRATTKTVTATRPRKTASPIN